MINKEIRPSDMMVCAMSRLLKDSEVVFNGVSSHMPLISILLAKKLHAPNAVCVNIAGGVDPKNVKIERFTSAGSSLVNRAASIVPLEEIFDLSMRGKLDVAFLSGVQFDKYGNVNASVIGDYKKPKVRLPGGAGSAVLIPTAKRAIIWRTKHDKRTFTNNMDFKTSRGNITHIVTPLCVFKMEENGFVVESIHPYSSKEEVIENTGFDVTFSGKVTEEPTFKEMSFLQRIDPKDIRNIEFE